jgi:acetyl-CoA synthetase
MENLSGEVFYPSKEILRKARVKDWDKLNDFASENLELFWEKEAKELKWFKKWDKVLDDSKKPFYKWFTNGKVNIAYNCLDVHLNTHRKNKVALIWEGEKGDQRSFSYFALHREVSRFSNALKSLGVVKGDRVTLYMGRIPELLIGMLACARIGAIHSVVYGGFSVESLHERLEDSH